MLVHFLCNHFLIVFVARKFSFLSCSPPSGFRARLFHAIRKRLKLRFPRLHAAFPSNLSSSATPHASPQDIKAPHPLMGRLYELEQWSETWNFHTGHPRELESNEVSKTLKIAISFSLSLQKFSWEKKN
jgi:hypothetical protein